MSDTDRAFELLVAIEARTQEAGTRLRAIENRLCRLEHALHLVGYPVENSRPASVDVKVPGRRPESVEMDNAVVAVLADGPLSVPEITRAVHHTDRVTDREQGVIRATLQRLLRDDRIRCHQRKWELRTQREEVRP